MISQMKFTRLWRADSTQIKEKLVKDFSEKDYPKKELTEKIINAAFTVHNRLGSGFEGNKN